MVTATTSEAKPTKTVKRIYLLQLQVRNLLARTTDISPDKLEKIADSGIANRWLRAVKVYGFDARNRAQCGLELEINWLTHTLEVVVWGEKVMVNKTVFRDDCAPELINAIVVFNQAVNAECLRTAWRVSYAEGVDVARVKQELALVDAAPLIWAGKVSQQAFGVSELPEMKVRLLIAETDELMPEEGQMSPQAGRQEKPAGNSATDSLFDRIKQALG